MNRFKCGPVDSRRACCARHAPAVGQASGEWTMTVGLPTCSVSPSYPINKANVKSLKAAWTSRLGVLNGHEGNRW